jgi:tRNA(adenine34) deaminase
MNMDDKFIKIAIKEALKAKSEGEVPVGAIIVLNDKVMARAHNKTNSMNDATAHAELLVIRKASKKIGDWRLGDCEIFVTLEPCPMCASAILLSRIRRVVFGAYDKECGAFGSKTNLKTIFPSYNPSLEIKGGELEHECIIIIKDFFNKIRNKYNSEGRDG